MRWVGGRKGWGRLCNYIVVSNSKRSNFLKSRGQSRTVSKSDSAREWLRTYRKASFTDNSPEILPNIKMFKTYT